MFSFLPLKCFWSHSRGCLFFCPRARREKTRIEERVTGKRHYPPSVERETQPIIQRPFFVSARARSAGSRAFRSEIPQRDTRCVVVLQIGKFLSHYLLARCRIEFGYRSMFFSFFFTLEIRTLFSPARNLFKILKAIMEHAYMYNEFICTFFFANKTDKVSRRREQTKYKKMYLKKKYL